MIRRIVRGLSLYFVLTVMLPIAVGAGLSWSHGWAANWRSANWGPSGLLQPAKHDPEARVLILAARTGRWKSIFAVHMSIVLKPRDAGEWTRYDVVGWGNPVRRNAFAPDAFWYGNKPYVVAEYSGDAAAGLIPRIEAMIAAYPNDRRGSYRVWPGPNSNSFVAWVVRHTEGFEAELPAVAIGKDYLGSGPLIDRAPSGTGVTLSAWGLFGLTLAREEGFELNLLGTTIGVDPMDLAIKLPSLGELRLRDIEL